MNKPLKIVLIAASIIAVLAIAALVAIVVLVDPNDFRDEIATRVKVATGRELIIAGDLELSIFPTLGLKLVDVSLGSPARFGEQPFIHVASAQLGMAVMPLLKSQLLVDRVVLDGLQLNLITLADGASNWVIESAAKQPTTPAADNAKAPTGQGVDLASITLGGLAISNGQVVWDDQRSGDKHRVENLALSVGAFSQGKPFSVELDARLKSNRLATPAEISLRTAALLNLEKQHLALSDIVLALEALQLTGNLQVLGFASGKPSINGVIELAQFDLKQLLRSLGVEPPETADPQALQKVSAQFEFSADAKQLQAKSFRLQLDDTPLQGSLGIENFSSPAIELEINIGMLDLDRYLPPVKAPDAKEPPQAAPGKAAKPATTDDFSAQLQPLKALKAKGAISIEQLKVKGLVSKQIRIDLNARDGKIAAPVQASLYQGTLRGDIGLDLNSAAPNFSARQTLTGLDLGLLGKEVFTSNRLSGLAVANVYLHSSGNNPEQLTANLNGNLDADIKDGILHGFNVDGAICKAQDAIKALQGSDYTACSEDRDSKFTVLRTGGMITNGVLQVSELFVEQPRQEAGKFLHITGGGAIDLVHSSLDLDIEAKKAKATGDPGNPYESGGEVIPVRITGSFQEPKIRPDVEKVLQGKAAEKLRDKLLEKLNKNDAAGTDAEAGTAPVSPQDQLKKQLLKGLFGG